MVFSKFESLSVRPPTPPKDLHDNEQDADATLSFLEDPFGEKPVPPRVAAAKAVLNTPEQSPSSDISIPLSSASRRKRVNFELQTCAIPSKKAIAKSFTPSRSSPLRPLPHTRVSRPLKSILKPSDGTPTPPPADAGAAAHKFKTFAEMLESIVKLLASSERPSRLDAYHSLQRTMQAYDKVPDDQALKQKMSLLTQFIRRDVQAPSPTGTGLDSQLIAQALKLLMALFRITDLITAMDDDFCSFIVDRVILVASDSSMPKSIVNTHLAVFMQQNFRPRTMTTTRVEKVLDVLDTIHERVSGFSVQAYRIRIYRKLIQQRPDIMIKHAERWFKLTVKALVACQKDINQSALDTAVAAAKTIGHDRHVAKSVLAVLNRVRNDGETLARVMTQELEKMLTGDNAAMVPQIWSAVTGLLRDSIQGQLFSAMKEWLKVFEKCLVSDKDVVKVHANVAFCFLLYAVNLAPNTSEGWTTMFLNIPLHQLQRRVPPKKAERDAITAGYVTLLYYALRPTASFDQLDRYWREFVAAFWSPLVHASSPQQAVAACRVVSALLNGSRKPWNEQRALDLRPQYMVQRGELPLLDPKWVRKSLSLVLQFVETLLEVTPWSENEQQEDEPVKTMWLAVLNSLVEASSKEVMASSETKDAMAHLVNLLRRVWDSHTAKLAVPQQKEDLWANKFCFLIETVVQKFGASRFADKCLTRNNDNEFEVASTPSHRSRQQGTRTSPLLYLTDLLINQSEGKLSDSVRLRAMKLMLEPSFSAQNTRFNRFELLRDCASAVDSSLKAVVAMSFWAQIASLIKSSIVEPISDINERVSHPYGKEYEIIVELLGLGSTFMLQRPQGQEVLSAFISMVRAEAGEGAVILAVIEPVSEHLLKRTSDEDKNSCLPYATILLQNLPRQMNRRILEQGRQNLWPSSSAAGRSHDFDPYTYLYGAIVDVGSVAYHHLNSTDVEPVKQFLAALGSSVQHCTTSHLAVFLRKTQQVIQVWVEDPEQKMQNKEHSLKALQCEVVNFWKEVNKAIERLPRKDSQILLHLENLITSGFVSRRRGIVNISITTWNSTFGKEESLRYPPRLEQALRQLRNTVELALPSLEVRSEDANHCPSFYDSDTNVEDIKLASKSLRVKDSPFKVTRSARKLASRSPAPPTSGSRRVSKRLTPKARLRHDNSQIQFQPIASSPGNPFDQESQVLTERQKEMMDRQRLTTGLFAKLGATSPLPEEVPSPMELRSDALSTDDYVSHASRTTPLKALAAMGPMDVFLGSSPTPHGRRSIQNVDSDTTSVATPTIVRTSKLAADDEPGSSPPRFHNNTPLMAVVNADDGHISSSFDYRQPESSHSLSFDEGTTTDEDALFAVELRSDPLSDIDMPEDTVMSELPSSTIDIQLTAQINADIHAHIVGATQSTEEAVAESNNEFVDAASHQLPSHQVLDAGSDTNIEDSQYSARPGALQNEPETDMSSTSRVNDSFQRPSSAKGTPISKNLRRSSRHSAIESPVQPTSSKKRRQTPARRGKNANAQEEETPASQSEVPEDVSSLNNIVVAPPKKQGKGRKRKHMSGDESPSGLGVVVPETNQKRSILRSQSLLSQVENSQDFLVEDTPAPKRARKSQNQDVSEAKMTLPSQTKRLSHVQVMPKRSPDYGGSSVRGTPTVTGTPIANTLADRAPAANISVAPMIIEPAPEPFEPSQSQRGLTAISTPSRSFTERVILTPRSIINQLKSLKDFLFSAPQLVLGREEEREIDDALFDIRRRVHAAGLRGDDTGSAGQGA